MRLAGVLSIINVHSWSDHALNLINSAAAAVGIVAAVVVVISIAFIYFTGTELSGRAKRSPRVPGEDPTKALRRSQAELAAARRSEETKASGVAKLEAELAATRRSEETKASRLAKLEAELTEARRSESATASQLARAETDLAATRRSEQTKTSRLSQLETELGVARHAEEVKALRLSQVEAELAAVQRSAEEKTVLLSQAETELAAARRSEEAKASRVAQLETELAAMRRSAEDAKTLAKQMEEKQGPRKITPEQRNQFLSAVRGLPTGKVIVSAFFDNKETHDFGAEILSLLKADGFEVVQRAPLNFFTTSRPSSGVRIGCENITNPPPHFLTVEKGFKAMGLETPTTSLINAREDDVVEIQVTPK
jgi:hypothetical protein